MRTPVFTGSCPALVTPFDERGAIDYAAFARQLERQLAAGAEAVCVCGTTGESATLTEKEHAALVDFCVRRVDGRARVIAGTGSNNTAAALRLTRQAQDCGADAALVVTPYYNKTTQDGLLRHYETIAQGTGLPLILYNVPGRTGLSFTAGTYAALAADERINGVKEASGSLALLTHTLALCPPDFTVWSGNDDQVVPMLALGAKGVISVAANILPERMAQLCRLCLTGDFLAAAQLQLELTPLMDALFVEVNPIPVKYAMDLMGLGAGPLRQPLCAISPEHGEQVRAALVQAGLLED